MSKNLTESFLIGKTVKAVRPMTKKELNGEGWDGRAGAVIEFDDGTLIYASRDEEGNGPGALFGAKDGKHFAFY